MPTVDTQLVDTEVDYCEPRDVFAHIRNKKYADLPSDSTALSQGGLTQNDVDDLISQMSERADAYTKRAWRTRKAQDVELNVRLSHKQKHARHRRRQTRTRSGRHTSQYRTRTFVDLPHNHVKPFDSNEGDAIIILNPNQTNDVTDNEGRDSGDYVVSNRKGVLRPDLDLLTPVGTRSAGPTLEEGVASVRVTYRYGHPHDVTTYDSDGDGVSDYVPPDVRDAVAMLVVARLLNGDQYGNLVPNAGDDTPSLSDASSRYESKAMDTLRDYRRA